MKTHRIAAIPGDGIGPEVIGAGLEVLQAIAARDGNFQVEVTSLGWMKDYYRRHGVMMPADGLDRLRDLDAIYFGAVGNSAIPDDSPFGASGSPSVKVSTSTRMSVRRAFCRVTLAASRFSPSALDWVIVRENSEGEYAGNGGRMHRGPRTKSLPRLHLHPRRRRAHHALRL